MSVGVAHTLALALVEGAAAAVATAAAAGAVAVVVATTVLEGAPGATGLVTEDEVVEDRVRLAA